MSPGDIIGSVSLGIQAAQLFGNCLQRYENLLEAFSMESDLSLLRCRLEIEMQRFRLWGDTAKITSGIEVPACHVQTVLKALRCVEDLFDGQDPIIKRYEDSIGSQTSGNDRGIIFGDVRHRTQWVLTDKKQLETTVNNIKSINDSLLSLLSETHKRQAARAFEELAISVVGTENKTKIEILGASTAGSYTDICALASLKALKLAINTSDTAYLGEAVEFPGLAPNHKWIDLPLGTLDSWNREVRLLDREPMVLEWRRLPKDAKKREQAVSKMRWLTPFLSKTVDIPNLRALEFHGTALDLRGEHMATVFKYPLTGISSGMEPVSLHHVITSETSDRWLPSLNNRFGLALSLSKAVLRLHACGWLHKSISSGNVLFFYPEGYENGTERLEAIDCAISAPFLQGYGYARAESTGQFGADAAFSESITTERAARVYRHPSTFESGEKRTKFRKTYDIYSLGVVLLEIGLWASCSPLTSGYSEPKAIKKMLVDKYLNGYLAYRTGNRYQDVVRTCLLSDFGPRGKEKNWQELEFMKKVVRKLEECSV